MSAQQGYRVEGGRVFWAAHEVKRVDVATFAILNKTWARDSSHVYSVGSLMRGVNPEEFVVLNQIYARDPSRIFYFGGHAKKIVHPESFEVLDDGLVDLDLHAPSPLGYARDEQYVYFYEETFGAPRPLRGVSPTSFQVLSYGYGADHKQVYCRGFRLRRATPGSFEILGPHHGRDTKRVFYAEQLIPDADPSTFEVVEGLCGKDSRHVFLWTTPVAGADPGSFETIKNEFLARDRTSVYSAGELLPGIDPDKFEPLGRGYFRHENAVYFLGRLLPDADVKTFTVLPHVEASDKRAYWRGELDVPEEAVSGYTAMDANTLYRTDFSKARKPATPPGNKPPDA